MKNRLVIPGAGEAGTAISAMINDVTQFEALIYDKMIDRQLKKLLEMGFTRYKELNDGKYKELKSEF